MNNPMAIQLPVRPATQGNTAPARSDAQMKS
jgi:hypothetical protein